MISDGSRWVTEMTKATLPSCRRSRSVDVSVSLQVLQEKTSLSAVIPGTRWELWKWCRREQMGRINRPCMFKQKGIYLREWPRAGIKRCRRGKKEGRGELPASQISRKSDVFTRSQRSGCRAESFQGNLNKCEWNGDLHEGEELGVYSLSGDLKRTSE